MESVADAWRDRDPRHPRAAPIRGRRIEGDGAIAIPASATDEPLLASVNGLPIARSRIVDLLLRSHGVGVLEQQIGLAAARDLAMTRGLTVAQGDVDHEFELALTRLSNPLASITPNKLDRATAERVLETVLAERNISREELFVILRRNAYLRRIVQSEQSFDEAQLRAEFERAYGERIQVRHIQLATLAEVGRVRDRLESGEDFGQLAGTYSANHASAQAGGLLAPFSRSDDLIPDGFRRAAFALNTGEVSGALRVGPWYHLIKLERRVPAEDQDFDRVRDVLERRLHDRLTESIMLQRYEALFREAKIEIFDPVLRRVFEKKHPGRIR